jgi:hypothetical protein
VTILPAQSPIWIWSFLWSLRRGLGLSPTQQVFREIERQGVDVRRARALEVFAGTGFRHTIDFRDKVGALEVWEVNPAHEQALRKNLPGATIKITDSFEEVRRTTERFDIIVVDNTITTFGKGYVEHFDLFPDIFRVAADRAVLVLNVCPEVPAAHRGDALRLERRAAFYQAARPENVPIDRMIETYSNLMRQSGFGLMWSFERRRAHRDGIHYLALGMAKNIS